VHHLQFRSRNLRVNTPRVDVLHVRHVLAPALQALHNDFDVLHASSLDFTAAGSLQLVKLRHLTLARARYLLHRHHVTLHPARTGRHLFEHHVGHCRRQANVLAVEWGGPGGSGGGGNFGELCDDV
jgi:hypothetical protein